MPVGEFLQEGLGLGGGGEDAAHGRQGEGAEADGPLEGGTDVVSCVVGDECQQLLRLQLALRLLGEQTVEELHRDGAELPEALAQQQFTLPWIVGGMMVLESLPHAGLRAGDERMTRDFLQADRVDDDVARGDAHRQHLADVRPRH